MLLVSWAKRFRSSSSCLSCSGLILSDAMTAEPVANVKEERRIGLRFTSNLQAFEWVSVSGGWGSTRSNWNLVVGGRSRGSLELWPGPERNTQP